MTTMPDNPIPAAAVDDSPINKALARAKRCRLKSIVIVGKHENGALFLASSLDSPAHDLWLLALAQHATLNREIDDV